MAELLIVGCMSGTRALMRLRELETFAMRSGVSVERLFIALDDASKAAKESARSFEDIAEELIKAECEDNGISYPIENFNAQRSALTRVRKGKGERARQRSQWSRKAV